MPLETPYVYVLDLVTAFSCSPAATYYFLFLKCLNCRVDGFFEAWPLYAYKIETLMFTVAALR